MPPTSLVAVLEPAAPVERLVVVAPFPTEADLERVRAEVGRVRRARRRARLAAALSSYIAPELFVRGLRGLDRDGAIRMLGDRMITAGRHRPRLRRGRARARAPVVDGVHGAPRRAARHDDDGATHGDRDRRRRRAHRLGRRATSTSSR